MLACGCAAALVVLEPSAVQADFQPTSVPVGDSKILRWLPVAENYWHEPPPCGRARILYAFDVPSGSVGWADWSACAIYINVNAAVTRRYPPALVCEIVLHEYGHLVLGPTYFARVNPQDPGHSPDPHNIMYRTMSRRPPRACR